MKYIQNELTDEQLAGTAGGFANAPKPVKVTTNPQVFSGAGHAQGDTWNAPGGTYYMVKAGDSLYKIARRNNMKLDDLEALNCHITNFQWIHPGDVIMLKKG